MFRFLSPKPVYAPDNDGGDGGDGGSTIPEGLPTQFWDQGSGAVKMQDFIKAHTELSTFKTQHDERLATLPKSPDEYKFEAKAPDGVKLPDGFELKIDEKDPRIQPIRQLAHKYQLPQDFVNELVGMDIQMQVAALEQADAELQAEMKKLGENGPVRVKAMEDYLKANVGGDEYDALRPVLGNAAAFSALEKVIAKAVKTSTPPNGAGDDPPPPQQKPRLADRMYGRAN